MRYFGEEWPSDACGACDNCLQPQEVFDATEIAKMILSAVLRTHERFGAGVVAGVLLGTEAAKKKQPWMAELSVFGIVKDFTEEEIKQLVRSLAEVGLLERSEGEYPVFSVSGAGKRFLKGAEPLELPKPLAAVKSKKKSRSGTAQPTGNYDEDLFQKLRALRKQLADDLGVPPFIVFGDASLRQMASLKPKTMEEFAGISGVGERKLAQFGKAFLGVTAS